MLHPLEWNPKSNQVTLKQATELANVGETLRRAMASNDHVCSQNLLFHTKITDITTVISLLPFFLYLENK